MNKPRLHVYYDGDCPMCQVFAGVVEKDETQTVKSAQTATTGPAPLSTMLDAIHAVEADGTIRTGPDAVLTALSYRFPVLTPIVKLVRFRVVKPFANLVYSFVARRRKLWFGGDEARLYWLRALTWVGLLGGLLAVLPLFIGKRTYPLVPMVPNLQLPGVFENVLFMIVIAACLLGIFATRHFSYLALLSLLPLSLLIVADYTRLQPWVWHYGILLVLFIFALRARTDLILNASRLLIAGIYFWSGFQKLNQAFFLEVFPWFTKALWAPWGEAGIMIALGFGILVPFLEMGIGLGLLIKPLRKFALFGAGAMLIIVLLSLILRDWNSSVWLWNIILFAMAFALFAGYTSTLMEFLKRTYTTVLGIFIFMLFWLIPFLNIFNLTDHYLSWSLYSGHVPTAHLIAEPTILQKAGIPVALVESPDVALLDWSMHELNVVPYPEIRVFMGIHEELCGRIGVQEDILLTIEERAFFYSLNPKKNIRSCLDNI